MDRVMTNADFRAETTRALKQLKHQLDVISGDISSIKRDIFLLQKRSIERKKGRRNSRRNRRNITRTPHGKKETEGWWWGYWITHKVFYYQK